MANLNALKAVKNVKKRLVDYCIEEHFVKESAFRKACRKIWEGAPEEGGLVGDLWVEGTFPNVTCGPSLSQRVLNGTFNDTLAKRIDENRGFGINWTPRSIQTESLDLAQEGYKADSKPAIVVTAGTGAGKTEAFLLPMLNDLFDRQATPGEGVSAIILYPMNALVKDQVDRMHSWLKGQDQVRMFSFTGATPHKHGSPHFTDGSTFSRFSSRDQARGLGIINQGGKFQRQVVPGYRPPEILVTNYSMLEYMLARPQDHMFFGNNLRTIVLDEAHLYRGNLAADISLLLRRLYLRCGVSASGVVQFATSATIGKGGETGERQLQQFTGSLFSKDSQQVHVIQGRAAEEAAFSATTSDFQFNPADLLAITPPDEATLTADDPPQFQPSLKWQEWRDYCLCLFGEHETAAAFEETDGKFAIASVLHRLLPCSPKFQTLYHILFQNGSPRRIRLPDLAEMILGESSDQNIECLRRMLELGAIARSEPGAMPLIPNRIHALFRAPDGLSFRFDSTSCKAETRINEHGFVFSPSRKPDPMDHDGGISLTLCRCLDSGLWFLAGVEDAHQRISEVPLHLIDRDQMPYADELDDGDERPIGERIRFFQMDEVDGHIWLDPQDGRISSVQGDGLIRLREYAECPVANVPLIKRARFFTSPTRLSLSIIVETLLTEMPTLPGASAAILPGGGRRLIAFSDSRREAARLGPSLQSQHEQQILRAVIARVFSEDLAEVIRKLANKINREELNLNSATDNDYRREIEESISDLQGNLRRMKEGLSLADFVERIKARPELDQIINDAKRDEHMSDRWVDDWNQNLESVHGEAFLKRRVGIELARRPSWPGLTTETTGLIEIIYPGIEELQIPNAIGQMGNPEGRGILTQEWPTFLKLLCDEIRIKGGITVDPNIDSENYMGKWVRFNGEGDGVRMLPANNHENTRMGRFLLSLCERIGFTRDWHTATALLQIAVGQLVDAASKPEIEWLELRPNANTNFRIDFRHLRFREPASLYRCEKSGQIWNHSLLGLAPSRSKIDLVKVNPAELDEDSLVGRRRREWRKTGDTDVFSVGLWAEEHSGQLDVKANEKIQNLFKAGMRNILSSTTTLELGIDIGGLSGVIMGNIPPGKANYLQRAGRAGRRADGSSLVCSFAKASPYERQAFLAFDQYIERDLPPPTVHLHREKILLSHLHMHLLSEFLRSQNMGDAGAMQAFGKMGTFTSRQVPARWNQLNQPRTNWDRPDGGGLSEDCLASMFIANLENLRLSPPTDAVRILCKEIQELENRWPDILDDAKFRFSGIVEDWRERFDKLGDVWNGQGEDEQDQRACNAIRHEGIAMVNTHVIEELGNGLFIPRYGFPINVMRLHVRRDGQDDQNTTDEQDDNRFKLERDCTMAIREYAPGSQVLAGGYRVTSHGILKHWTGQNVGGDHNAMLSRGRWMSGDNGFNVEMGYNGNPQQNAFKHLLLPKHGFTTAEWDPPRRAYSLESVGKTLMKTDAFNHRPDDELRSELFPGLDCWHVEGGQLFVLNQGSYDQGFSVCLKCGFSQSEKEEGWGDDSLPKRFDQHRYIFSNSKCWNNGENPKLRHQVLAVRQITNLLFVDFSSYVDNADIAFTLAQALRLAGSELLHLDYREIRSLEQISGFANPQGYGVVLYDTLSGGSGHLEELSKMGKQWLQAAMTLITVEGASCDEWREREAILRLLTSDVRDFEADYKFKPLETLEVLRQIQNGQGLDLQGDTGNNAQISADVWNHQRIASGEKLPNRFDFSPPDVSMKTMTPYESQDPPKNGQFCIVQLADGSLDCGKWIYRALQAGGNAVMMFRLAGSSGMNIQSQTTEDELPQVIAIECI
jgi:DEAD/DEAH box helicase domain-containing protein